MSFRFIALVAAAATLTASLSGPAAAGSLEPAVAVAPPTVVAAASPMAAPRVANGDWQSGYIGVQLSYGSADGNGSFGDDKSTGGFYGVTSGYRYDFGRIVLGGGISYDRTDITFPNGTDIDNLLRAGITVGYDLGSFLPYVSGGYSGVSLVNDPLDFDDQYHGGYYGVGLAYRVTEHVIIGADIIQHRYDADGVDADLTTFSGSIAYRF